MLTSISISNSTSIAIDNFTIYGKSLDNIPLDLPKVEITSHKNGDYVYLTSELTIKGCLDIDSNTPTSSSHSINLTGLPSDDNQSSLSSVSRVINDGLENKIIEQHKSSDQSRTNLQNNMYSKPIHYNNDQSQGQSQSQSTLSPNSGQSTTGNP